MRLLMILILVLLLQFAALAQTVPDDYPTIQQAINALPPGSTITVLPGVYFENIDFLGKVLTVQSELGPSVTLIDGCQAGSVVTFDTGEGSNSVLDGFTIMNGSGTDISPPNGWFCGGGIYCSHASPTIKNNVIRDNVVLGMPGGHGGGIYCWNYSNPTIYRNVIADNISTNDGAGISCSWQGGSPLIDSNHILRNVTDVDAGGIDCWLGYPRIINNVIAENAAYCNAGGIRCVAASPFITNNTVCHNWAAFNAGGIECGNGVPVITNTIVWDNSAQNWPEISGGGIVTYCDVMGGWPGTGNIAVNPQFFGSGDYHLTWNSPCKDTGTNTAPELPSEDFEGDPRICYGTADMGADEYWYHLYHVGAVVPGAAVSIRIVGVPNLPVLLGMGSSIQDPPTNTPYGLLYLPMPLLRSWNLGNIPGSGILSTTRTVPPWWSAGQRFSFQALVGPWSYWNGVLTNPMVLTVE